MSVGWYFARAVAVWFFGLCAVVCGLLVAWSTLVPGPVEALPSPWALVPPLFLLATAITWGRARRRGELLAVAAGGVGFVACVQTVLVGVALQGMFAIPEGRVPKSRSARAAVQRSVDGELFLTQASGGVLLSLDGRVTRVAGRPEGFRAAPHNPQRYRRQMFFTSSLRLVPRDRLDPWLWRWLFSIGGICVPALLLRARSAWLWCIGGLPLLLPLLVL